MATPEYDRTWRRETEAFYRDHLAVDLKSLGPVLDKLRDGLGIVPAEREISEALGLALLKLPDLDNAIDGLPVRAEIMSAAEREGGPAYRSTPLSPLDVLLFYLRREFAAEHHGWYPDLAKNRVQEQVAGAPYSGGGVGKPKPVEGFALPARQADRDVTRPRARLCVFDTPIHPHRDLAGRYQADVPLPETERWATAGHCVLVCSVAAEQAPEAEFVIRPVLDPRTLTSTSWELAKAMIRSRNDNVDIFVMALGGASADGKEPLVLARACERTPGIVKVAALGNHGTDPDPDDPDAPPRPSMIPPSLPMWPAASPTVIAVGADYGPPHDAAGAEGGPVDEKGLRAYFSPSLEEAPWTGCMAPGTGMRGLFLGGEVRVVEPNLADGVLEETGEVLIFGDAYAKDGYAEWAGSSFSAAYVAGVIADEAERHGISAQEAARRVLRPPSDPDVPGIFSTRRVRPVRPH